MACWRCLPHAGILSSTKPVVHTPPRPKAFCWESWDVSHCSPSPTRRRLPPPPPCHTWNRPVAAPMATAAATLPSAGPVDGGAPSRSLLCAAATLPSAGPVDGGAPSRSLLCAAAATLHPGPRPPPSSRRPCLKAVNGTARRSSEGVTSPAGASERRWWRRGTAWSLYVARCSTCTRGVYV